MARVSTATRLSALGLLALIGLGCGARSDLGAPRDEANGGSASTGGSGGSGGTGSDGGAPAGCGNGVVEGREQCDDGALNEDRPALSLLNENLGADFVPVQPVVGSANAVQLYAFSSQSAHTGFERVFSSVLFVYRQAGVGSLDLFTIHGIDLESTGLDSGDCAMTERFTGLPPGWFLAVSDDTPQEFDVVGPDEAFGDWEWHHNSDGGVISGLPFPGTWTVQIDAELQPCAPTWEFRDGGGEWLTLATPSSQLRAFGSPSACRTDCTVPVCGDGIVDGGEVCDDGNNTSGDGCAGDCSFAQ